MSSQASYYPDTEPAPLATLTARLAGYSEADAWQRPDAPPIADVLNIIARPLESNGWRLGKADDDSVVFVSGALEFTGIVRAIIDRAPAPISDQYPHTILDPYGDAVIGVADCGDIIPIFPRRSPGSGLTSNQED